MTAVSQEKLKLVSTAAAQLSRLLPVRTAKLNHLVEELTAMGLVKTLLLLTDPVTRAFCK